MSVASHACQKSLRLLGIILLLVWPAGIAKAQIRFIQLTDPHLFDSDEEKENKKALIDAVWKINELNKNVEHAFVVVTGDIGIEQIVKPAAKAEIAAKLDDAASAMANILAVSEVPVWLFVPGNNDLIDERPDTIGHYHQFISKLRVLLLPYHIEAIDLCPQAGSQAYSPSKYPQYTFVGFNNASFKNNNDVSRVLLQRCGGKCSPPANIRRAQTNEIDKVSRELNNTHAKFAFLFYHIPEVDDPYFKTGSSDDWKLYDFRRNRSAASVVTRGYENSSWFVDSELRDAWKSLVNSDKVRGLFAGHLHSAERTLYRTNREEPKLHVCPPLAVKRQLDEALQARGFMQVAIDEDGGSGKPDVTVKPEIYWYDQKTWLFSKGPYAAGWVTPLPAQGGNMNWETAAQISTFFQLFLLAGSVILIWWQLKKQTDLTRIANTQAQVALVSPFNLEIAKDPDLAKLWMVNPKEWADLNPGEKHQYESMLIWWLIFYENIFFQKQSKLLNQEIFNAWQQDLDAFIKEKHLENYWPRPGKYNQLFVDYVTGQLELKSRKN